MLHHGTREPAEEHEMVERLILVDPSNPAESHTLEGGVPIYALIGYARVVGGDVERVAGAYHLSLEAVRAALAYYERNRAAVDAFLAANDAA